MGWYNCMVLMAAAVIMASVFVVNVSVIYLLDVVAVRTPEFKAQKLHCADAIFQTRCHLFGARLSILTIAILLAASQIVACASAIIDIYKCWKAWIVTHFFGLIVLVGLFVSVFVVYREDRQECKGDVSTVIMRSNVTLGLPGGCPKSKADTVVVLYVVYMAAIALDIVVSFVGLCSFSIANCR